MERRSVFTEQSGSKVGRVNRHLRRSYDANFKIKVINAAEVPNRFFSFSLGSLFQICKKQNYHTLMDSHKEKKERN